MKEPWEMRRDEYAATATGDEAEAAIKRLSIEMPGFVGRQRSMWPVGRFFGKAHRLLILEALTAGKPVPPEVLADYPDLAARYPA